MIFLQLRMHKSKYGKEDKIKVSFGFSENSSDTNSHSIINALSSHKTSSSESINKYSQSDFIFDTNFFTRELETFSCMAFLSTGSHVLSPQKIKLTPYFILDNKI